MNVQRVIELTIAALIIVAALTVMVYSSYYINRWWNYTFAYENMVKETVCEMVKPEFLKDSTACKK